MSETIPTNKPCPVPGCTTVIHKDNDMCFRHWRMVPEPLQNDVRVNRGTELYTVALQVAVQAIQNAEIQKRIS